MTIKIIADSSANLRTDLSRNFISVPLHIHVDHQVFDDCDPYPINEMIEAIETASKSSSSCPSIGEYLESYEGGDEIYVFPLTSKLSGSYSAALQAKDIYLKNHSECKINIFDTLTTGPQLELLIEYSYELIKKQYSFEKNVEMINEYHQSTGLHFVLCGVKTLAQNGRVPLSLSKIIGVLGLKIIAYAKDGVIKPIAQGKGSKKTMSRVYNEMKKSGYHGGKMIISHCHNLKDASFLKNLVLEEFNNADVRIDETNLLCSYYAQEFGIIIGYEK